MPKRLFRKYLPSPETLQQHKSLRFLGEVLGNPNLWHINRRSLANAAFIGIFCGFLPMPFQMAVAAMMAVRFSGNLPFSVVLVWFSNPLTYVPVFYFTYRVGAWMMGLPVVKPPHVSMAWFFEQLVPLWVGSVTCGIIFGWLGRLLIQGVWRLSVARSWSARQHRRRQGRNPSSSDDSRPS